MTSRSICWLKGQLKRVFWRETKGLEKFGESSCKWANERRIGTLWPIDTPETPNDLWAIDTIVMGSAARDSSAKYIITVVDHHSRFVWASANKANTAAAAINVLSKAVDSVGPPKASCWAITERTSRPTHSEDTSQTMASNL